ncbi:hypothetical protein ASG40_12115 [Methylobacterium sp. Leaf399]|uniref:bestrophin-like domain n=1 Tax=unclassified Methylobacterium TaxID=2615210 RepID=UPI0006F5C9D5|nr:MULTISPECIES: DUF4239 domain-containing protein [unclassified Methylobacterium]KQP50489.1 hypothetical protein ASF39_12410 [Methylobacterium sp. Leaf108]KQT08612.1 hypothetical protein ASG40_12115 [Methylobacterium sp. Leaf399]KQT78735.1 hypothetical protein ASG59_05970 [Methylobacterium sp. Leaf466]
MVLAYWLDQPVWLIFVWIAAVFGFASALIVGLTVLPMTRPAMARIGGGMVPTYFTAISVLLALLTGFVANDAWERQRTATRIVQSERSGLLAIHDLSIAAVSDMKDLRAELVAYADALITDEWPKMADATSSAKAGETLGRLMQGAADPRHGTEAGAAAHSALLDAVMGLRTARGERLSLSDATADQSKWLTLMVLAGLTMLSIGFVHMDRPVTQLTALMLFSTAMVTTLGVVALHERPFDGPLALSSAPLQAARAVMEAARPGG